jgi:hypothetical protein
LVVLREKIITFGEPTFEHLLSFEYEYFLVVELRS